LLDFPIPPELLADPFESRLLESWNQYSKGNKNKPRRRKRPNKSKNMKDNQPAWTNIKLYLALSVLGSTLIPSISSAQSVNTPPRVLAARWWQWAMETPASQSPLLDQTGQFAALNQPHGAVWFLAGNEGGTSVRSITVPSGKAIFFPVVNVFDVEDGTAVGGGGKVFSVKNPLQTAQALVGTIIATATGMFCSVDGNPVPINSNNLEVSTPFTLNLDSDNLLGLPKGVYYPTVDSGYYVFLPPLSSGQHTIHFGGGLTFFGPFSLDVTYHITVQ